MLKDEINEIKELLAANTPSETVEETIEETVEPITDEIVEETVEETPDEIVEETVEDADEQYTMESFAAAVEIDQGDLYKIMIPKAEGFEPMTIGEMKDDYRKTVKANKEMENTISEQLKMIETGSSTQTQTSQQDMALQMELLSIQNDYDNTDWKDLEEYEPGQAALQKQKLNDRYGQAMYAKNQRDMQLQTEYQTFLQSERVKMIELIPEWKDEAVEKADKILMDAGFLEAGYSREIIDNIADPIAMSLFRELIMLRQTVANGKELVKKVNKAPKVLKAGGRFKKPTNQDQLNGIVNKAKKSGNRNDQLAAVKALLVAG